MIKFEHHNDIEYSETKTLTDYVIDVSASVKNRQVVLEVGNKFPLLGYEYVLVKSVYKANKVYYQFIGKKGELENE